MLKYNLSQIDSLSKKILSFLSKSDCIFLFGELGSGKTTFVRSLIHQLQEKNKIKKTEVTSPTYNLLNEYEIQNLKIMHSTFDWNFDDFLIPSGERDWGVRSLPGDLFDT